ncbi:MAG: pilus assembly protein [Dehalococcoidia bacterium]|nr:MAG: pilus assembly protein [Dehalococcoidia bacterium]
MRGEKGSAIISWALLTPLIFFVVFAGFVMIHLNQIRACAAMAARESARDYGINHKESNARRVAWDVLKQEGLLSENAAYPKGGSRNFNADNDVKFTEDGAWVTCVITYRMPNALPLVPRLAAAEDNPSWWPKEFIFKAAGSAKHEYED